MIAAVLFALLIPPNCALWSDGGCLATPCQFVWGRDGGCP